MLNFRFAYISGLLWDILLDLDDLSPSTSSIVLFTKISSQQTFFWITTLRRRLWILGLQSYLWNWIYRHVLTRVMGTFGP
ncbi:hypothetical protein OROMI_023905 [Orobanche minor]